jgi:glutamate dehydrogenase (NADP+)
MATDGQETLEQFMKGVRQRNPGQTEYHQAVHEVAANVFDFIADNKVYHEMRILRRIAEPDRIIIFRVCWEDDRGRVRINRGYRVQNSNAIGPYKGGIRFHQSVNLSILKFLAFEQTFKNALTGLPLGGGKGGSDFDPRGKSEREIMRDIHDRCVRYGESADREHINYARGANIAGFVRVADAMVAYGIV